MSGIPFLYSPLRSRYEIGGRGGSVSKKNVTYPGVLYTYTCEIGFSVGNRCGGGELGFPRTRHESSCGSLVSGYDQDLRTNRVNLFFEVQLSVIRNRPHILCPRPVRVRDRVVRGMGDPSHISPPGLFSGSFRPTGRNSY